MTFGLTLDKITRHLMRKHNYGTLTDMLKSSEVSPDKSLVNILNSPNIGTIHIENIGLPDIVRFLRQCPKSGEFQHDCSYIYNEGKPPTTDDFPFYNEVSLYLMSAV